MLDGPAARRVRHYHREEWMSAGCCDAHHREHRGSMSDERHGRCCFGDRRYLGAQGQTVGMMMPAAHGGERYTAAVTPPAAAVAASPDSFDGNAFAPSSSLEPRCKVVRGNPAL
mmetsp:Transcript_99129/g.175682  ORF Transcript_99129/g.175682 Transcript_99129/m.175682 type:complete len:114 (+) Transcript_99129:403-744(+)